MLFTEHRLSADMTLFNVSQKKKYSYMSNSASWDIRMADPIESEEWPTLLLQDDNSRLTCKLKYGNATYCLIQQAILRSGVRNAMNIMDISCKNPLPMARRERTTLLTEDEERVIGEQMLAVEQPEEPTEVRNAVAHIQQQLRTDDLRNARAHVYEFVYRFRHIEHLPEIARGLVLYCNLSVTDINVILSEHLII
jgi:hypothetical protein